MFKNLEQRFNEKVNQLYAGATSKFDNGKSSNGFNDDPLNVRRPGNESFGRVSRALGRFLPLVRAGQDTIRLTKFLASVRGATFLAKQQLLQTGNTFETTRVLNPVFVLGAAAAPGIGNAVRMRRHLRPINTLLSRTDTSDLNVKKLGQLQETTYRNVLARVNREYGVGGTRPNLTGRIFSPISNFISAATAKKNVGELFEFTELGWKKSRPELGETNNDYFVLRYLLDTKLSTSRFEVTAQRYKATNSDYITYMNNPYGKTDRQEAAYIRNKQLVESIRRQGVEAFRQQNTSYATSIPYIKYFEGGEGSIRGLVQFDRDGSIVSQNAKELAEAQPAATRKISYIKDPGNVTGSVVQRLEPYKTLKSSFDDPIIVSFAMGRDEPVQFRAFIKDIVENATPEYKTSQYIGRMEKFVSFVSVQREISFKLGVIAFSKDELETVWRKINYLTGMVFPYGINRGILQPNIIRLTIGNLFDRQPGYITSLTKNFSEVSDSWDIDAKVPIGASMDIRFTIIEKRTSTAASPLYKITEEMRGFSKTLTATSTTSTTT